MTAEDDATLIDCLSRPHSQVEWLALMHRVQGPLHQLGRRMGLSHEECEEALQETLVRLNEDLAQRRYDPAKGSLFSWIWRLGRWKCIEQYRRRPADLSHRATLREEEWLEQAEPGWDPRPAERERWRAAFEHALEELPRHVSELEFRAFRLLVVERCDGASAASALGISRNGVYLHKHRAMERLREIAARRLGPEA